MKYFKAGHFEGFLMSNLFFVEMIEYFAIEWLLLLRDFLNLMKIYQFCDEILIWKEMSSSIQQLRHANCLIRWGRPGFDPDIFLIRPIEIFWSERKQIAKMAFWGEPDLNVADPVRLVQQKNCPTRVKKFRC